MMFISNKTKGSYKLAMAMKLVLHESIWHNLYNLKDMKNTHGSVILLVKLQASTSNFSISNTPSMGVFHVF